MQSQKTRKQHGMEDFEARIVNRIIEIIAKTSAHDPHSIKLESRLLHDLGVYGDDADDVLLALQNEFQVDLSRFTFVNYFFSEGPVGILPEWLYRRVAERKLPLTVARLVEVALSEDKQLI